MDPTKTFWRVSGGVLVVAGAAGLALTALGQQRALAPYATFDPLNDWLHVGLGVAGLALGFAPVPAAWSKRAALVVGTLLVAYAVAGFVSALLWLYPSRWGFTTFRLEFTENIFHLAVGAWAAYVGSQEEDARAG